MKWWASRILHRLSLRVYTIRRVTRNAFSTCHVRRMSATPAITGTKIGRIVGVFYVLTNQISHYHVVEKFHYDMIISYARPPDGTLATINPFLPDNILNQNRYARTLRTHSAHAHTQYRLAPRQMLLEDNNIGH